MAKIPKLIKAAINFTKSLPEQVLSQGQALLKGLTGNSNFTNLPVDLNVFKADLDSYAVSIADAKDGGKKAIALRNKLGEDRKSTRLNSSHRCISYAVFCLKKKKKKKAI